MLLLLAATLYIVICFVCYDNGHDFLVPATQPAVEPPTPVEPETIDPVKPEPTPEPVLPAVDYTKFNVPELRKACTQHNIAWRNVRGKNKHALKADMIEALTNL